MATSSIAAGAYQALANLANRSAGGAPAAGGGEDFGDMLRQAIGSGAQRAREADGKLQGMAAGQADIVDVVTAVSETEVAIQTLVSVRDRVIQSYEEIMRMPI